MGDLNFANMVALLVVIGALWWFLGGRRTLANAGLGKTYVCTQCGFVGLPNWKVPGSTAITFILLWFFIIPAVIYSIWRNSNRFPACPQCGAPRSMIPSDSQMGKQYLPQPAGSIVASGSTPVASRQEHPCPWCAEPILLQAKICKHCGRHVAAA
jgi:predicted RNA-binding Zn-ribbon protein involved in translation (DUF1610 family)